MGEEEVPLPATENGVESREERQAWLQKELTEARTRLTRDQWRVSAIHLTLAMGLPTVLIVWRLDPRSLFVPLISGFLVGTLPGLGPSRVNWLFKVQELDDQLEALRFENERFDLRSERQFKQHQAELKRYYDQALQQSQWVFVLGVACIGAGIGLVLYCVYLMALHLPRSHPANRWWLPA